jgi:hypothetical protein
MCKLGQAVAVVISSVKTKRASNSVEGAAAAAAYMPGTFSHIDYSPPYRQHPTRPRSRTRLSGSLIIKHVNPSAYVTRMDAR